MRNTKQFVLNKKQNLCFTKKNYSTLIKQIHEFAVEKHVERKIIYN